MIAILTQRLQAVIKVKINKTNTKTALKLKQNSAVIDRFHNRTFTITDVVLTHSNIEYR